MYSLNQIDELKKPSKKINGRYVPVRPFVGPFVNRLMDAWAVLTGKADAFCWPENQ